jgi:hypothetical protein
MENAIFNRVDFLDGYIYSPPAWRVCGCENGKYTKRIKSGAGSALDGAEYDLTIPCRECADSPLPGWIPQYYTPTEYRDWIRRENEMPDYELPNDTPVWVMSDGAWIILASYGNFKNTNAPIIIATEAGKPPEDYNGT